jgi:flagellar hook protein FlgE
MSMSSALNASISGLSANSNRLSTISDNIANSQTMGYKRSGVDFSTVALQASGKTYTAGGVTTQVVRDVQAKGGFVGSSNATDLAIAGRGMFPVTSISAVTTRQGQDLPLMLAPTGSFQPDAQGVLRTSSGLVLMGYPADMQGRVEDYPRDTAAFLQPIVIDRSAVAAASTTQVNLNANLPASATVGNSPLTAEYPVSIQYFDNLGAPQSMAFVFKPVEDGGTGMPLPNTWTLQIFDYGTLLPDGSPTPMGEATLAFDPTSGRPGALASVTPSGTPPLAGYDAATGRVTLTVANGQEISVGIGATAPEGPNFLSQLSTVFSPMGVTADGSAAGTYTGVTMDQNGFLSINYSSGFSRVIYKVPVADVPNMNGLRPTDSGAYTVSRESGPVYFWDAGTGPSGSIMGFAQEQSATDIARELTDLIQTQRAYSSNAKIVQTVDEMLQETTNLKR